MVRACLPSLRHWWARRGYPVPASGSRASPRRIVAGDSARRDISGVGRRVIPGWSTRRLRDNRSERRPRFAGAGIGSLDARTLPGTEGARGPFWSPDSRSVAFFVGRKLKRTNLFRQDPQTVAEVDVQPRGGTWSGSGVIVFPGGFEGQLHRVDVNGGPVIAVTKLDDGERAHAWPHFLPDGRSFLYRVVGASPAQSGTYIGSLDSDEKTRVLDGFSSAAIYAPPGYLIFVRDGSLVAQRIDLPRRRLDGPLLQVAANVVAPNQTPRLDFSAGQAGVVSSRHRGPPRPTRVVRSRGSVTGRARWVDRF